MIKLTEIPKREAITIMDQAAMKELDRLITILDFQIVKLKGMKEELLKLK